MSKMKTLVTCLALAFVACRSNGSDGVTTAPPPPPPPPPPAAVASVQVALGSGSIVAGQTTAASATTLDGSGNVLTGRTVTWSSSNSTVATVDATGVVHGVSAGTANITAVSEGKSGSAPLSVTPLIIPVATVNVSLARSTIVAGQTTSATATTLDGSGNPLNGRSVTWSSSNPTVATVGASGAVQTVSPGTANIVATSEGKSGSSALTVVAAVASVTLNGSIRDKVGDAYTYTVTEKLADSTVVQRPATFGVTPSNGALITAGGILTPSTAGTITVVITIDGVQWTAPVTAYDWVAINSSGQIGAALAGDIPVTNFLGVAEYPTLLIGCGSGTFAVGVGFTGIITATGLVTYAGDNGNIIQETWLESPPDFNILAYPGLTSGIQKAFALTLATNHLFTFAFTEFVDNTHATSWRLTGMSTAIAPAIAACPGNSLVASDRGPVATLMAAIHPSTSTAPALSVRRSERGEASASSIRAPLTAALRAPAHTTMQRVPR
jgi:uncharacterized protein YjdB